MRQLGFGLLRDEAMQTVYREGENLGRGGGIRGERCLTATRNGTFSLAKEQAFI